MANPYFISLPLHPGCNKAYESAMPVSGSVLNVCPQQSGLAFGMQVEQSVSGSVLNTSISRIKSFYNPCTDPSLKKLPVRVIYSQETDQKEPLDFSQKHKAHQYADQNTKILTSQSELRVDRVRSMAGEASFQPYPINASHPALSSTLRDTAESSLPNTDSKSSSFTSLGPEAALRISCQQGSVNESQHSSNLFTNSQANCRKNVTLSSQDAIFSLSFNRIGETIGTDRVQAQYWQPPSGKVTQQPAQAKYRQSPAGKANQKAAQAKYRQSPAGKANQKAAQAKYRQSTVGKITHKVAQAKYRQSPAGKAAQKAAQAKYRQSPAGKAVIAINNAKNYAYRKELAKSGNANLARQKGVEAALEKRLELQNNNVDQIGHPLFSRKAEGVFTHLIEPISP